MLRLYHAANPSSPCDRADDQQWFLSGRNRIRQWGVWRLVRKILLAGKEAQECPPLLRVMIANRATQHRISRFERVEHRAHRNRRLDLELYFAAHLRKRAQMLGEFDSDGHDSVCTSTEYTAGRSRTIGAQESPASADAYTCPPVVPK